jgi:acylphosphatase
VAAFHLFIDGRVQGVGYRAALADTAQALGLGGWVRNCRDGRVEAEIHGSQERCAALIAWARQGPPAARVTQVQAKPLATEVTAPDRAHRNFEIRASV